MIGSRWAMPVALSTICVLVVPPAGGALGSKAGFLAAPGVRVGPAIPGEQLWVKRYNGTGNAGNGYDDATALGVSPDGSSVFVTGLSSAGENVDYATVAHNASTGKLLWVRRYNGPANSFDGANALGVSPDGTEVFVTGESARPRGSFDYATVAYNAPTGAQLWVRRYNGPGNGIDEAFAVGVSPDVSTVFVTGRSYSGPTTDFDYATVAYDASTGAKLWVKRYNGPGNGIDVATALGVSPDGSTVSVTGSSYGGSTTDFDYATVAYDASTGAQLWVKRYNGPGNGDDEARALGVSPDGSTVFVTGRSYGGPTSSFDYATVAYSIT